MTFISAKECKHLNIIMDFFVKNRNMSMTGRPIYVLHFVNGEMDAGNVIVTDYHAKVHHCRCGKKFHQMQQIGQRIQIFPQRVHLQLAR